MGFVFNHLLVFWQKHDLQIGSILRSCIKVVEDLFISVKRGQFQPLDHWVPPHIFISELDNTLYTKMCSVWNTRVKWAQKPSSNKFHYVKQSCASDRQGSLHLDEISLTLQCNYLLLWPPHTHMMCISQCDKFLVRFVHLYVTYLSD